MPVTGRSEPLTCGEVISCQAPMSSNFASTRLPVSAARPLPASVAAESSTTARNILIAVDLGAGAAAMVGFSQN
ncbi:MAG: hypothetical protein ACWGG5_04035 [Stenotrophomonas sp.]